MLTDTSDSSSALKARSLLCRCKQLRVNRRSLLLGTRSHHLLSSPSPEVVLTLTVGMDTASFSTAVGV